MFKAPICLVLTCFVCSTKPISKYRLLVIFRYALRKSIQQRHKAATVMQSSVRQFLEQRKYQRLQKSTYLIQRTWRNVLLTKETQAIYMEQRQAAITLQSHVREYLLTRKQKRSASVIQNAVRAYALRNRYIRQHDAVITIQQWYRTIERTRCERVSFLIQKGASITIQTWWRGVLCRRVVNELHHAATVIQSSYRGYRVKRDYHYLRYDQFFLSCNIKFDNVQFVNEYLLVLQVFICY